MTENVIIIGGGPAGLAASIYLSRAQLKPLVFAGSPPGGQLMLTSEIENFPGIESILGSDLIAKFRAQATKFGARIVDENVQSVDFSKKPFKTNLTNSSNWSNSILIATGAKALWLGLSSEARLRGKGVSACATCDGFFFKNKTVGVVGGGDTAMEEALTLTKFASKVYLIHRRDSFRASKIMIERVKTNPKIEIIWNTVVEEVVGEKKVEGIKLKSVQKPSDSNRFQPIPTDSQLQVDGIFVAIGHKPDTEMFNGKVELDDRGYIITNSNIKGQSSKFPNMTSVSGVFAAGDCVDSIYQQAAVASGMGVEAALDIINFMTII